MASDKKVDNLLDTLYALARLGLLCLGVLGLAFEFFKDDGLLQWLFDHVFESTTSIVISLIAIGVLYVINRWLSTADGKASRKGDIPLYAMMFVGAYYAYQLFTTGGF